MNNVRFQNIPIRSDLGAKLRKILRDQRPLPPAVARLDYAAIETAIATRLEKKP